MTSPSATGSDAKSVHIVRSFAATPAQVFAAWSSPEQLVQWYAPTGCTIEITAMDFQVGGRYHTCIHTPTGYACWCVGEYRVIDAPHRLVFTMTNADEAGSQIDPTTIGMDPEWPAETTVDVVFTPEGEGTRMELRQTVSSELAQKTGALPSWLQMFDRLADLTTFTT